MDRIEKIIDPNHKIWIRAADQAVVKKEITFDPPIKDGIIRMIMVFFTPIGGQWVPVDESEATMCEIRCYHEDGTEDQIIGRMKPKEK